MSRETERLVNEVKKELLALRTMIQDRDNPKLLKTYRELVSTLD